MRIVFAYADMPYELNTTIWRCFIPGQCLKLIGYEVEFVHVSDLEKVHADVVVIERSFHNPVVHYAVHRLKGEEAKVIGTFDDSYGIMPDYVRSKPNWNPTNLARFNNCLRFFDTVIVPSEILAEDYHRYCKDMRVVKNYSDGLLYEGLKHKPDQGNLVRLFYGGNDTHHHSVIESGLIPALQRLFEKYPHAVMYAVGSENICNVFLDALPEGRVSVRPWIPIDDWPGFVAEHADIILAPLSGEYDRRRSSVKANDSALLSIPMVASDLDPYRDTGAKLVANNEKAWYDALSNLVYSEYARYTLGKKITKTMGDVRMLENIHEYEGLWK